MEAIRIKQRIESENLYLPVFKNFIGKNAEIIVLIEPEEAPKLTKRVPGRAKELISISDDFNAPLPDEIIEEFYK